MIHVANTSMAGCGVMINIMCLVTGNAGVLGDIVRIMTRSAGVSAWTIIARRATVLRHATMIIATIMSAGGGSSRVAMTGVVIVAGRATMAAVGTATRVASRCSATAGTAVPSAIPAADTVAATAAVAAAAIPATTTPAVAAATTSAIPATSAVATTATAAVVSHGTLDMPCMRSCIEPPRGRGHRQSTRADRQDEQQRSPTSVGA
jgi:hypothetical protein